MSAQVKPVDLNPVTKYRRNYVELRNEYQSEGWEDHHKELVHWFLPRKGWFVDTDQSSRGDKKNQNIINTSPLDSSNTLASGMMAGITSPTRPWFKLATSDLALREFGPVKIWLEQVERLMLQVFSRSNVYKVLHGIYRDLGVFGTGAMSLEFDTQDIIRAYPHPVGSYVIGLDDRLSTNMFYREIPYKVYQVVQKFGLANCSSAVQNMYQSQNLNNIVKVIHGIEPNNLRDLNSALPKDMPWKSVYFEKSNNEGKFLRDSGFQEMPVMTPRWVVNGTDAYGASPGMDTLGVNKSLQIKERRKNTLVDKLTDPPMQGPSSLQQGYATLVSGEITFLDPGANGAEFKPSQRIEHQAITVLREDIFEQTKEIQRAFFTDLFLMLTNIDRTQMTATEVAERHEEKLLMLGPVLENIHNDLLDPLVDRTFNILARNGLLPEPPEELAETELSVEYISILAQAQRAVGVNSIRHTVSFATEVSQVAGPGVLDKIDFDQAIDEFADMQGVPPTIIRSDDQVEAIRAGRAAAEQAQRNAEEIPGQAKAIKDLSEAQVGPDGGSALDALTTGVANA